MPTSYMKSLKRKKGLSKSEVAELERIWQRAKDVVSKEYGAIKWPIVTKVFKDMAAKETSLSKSDLGESVDDPMEPRQPPLYYKYRPGSDHHATRQPWDQGCCACTHFLPYDNEESAVSDRTSGDCALYRVRVSGLDWCLSWARKLPEYNSEIDVPDAVSESVSRGMVEAKRRGMHVSSIVTSLLRGTVSPHVVSALASYEYNHDRTHWAPQEAIEWARSLTSADTDRVHHAYADEAMNLADGSGLPVAIIAELYRRGGGGKSSRARATAFAAGYPYEQDWDLADVCGMIDEDGDIRTSDTALVHHLRESLNKYAAGLTRNDRSRAARRGAARRDMRSGRAMVRPRRPTGAGRSIVSPSRKPSKSGDSNTTGTVSVDDVEGYVDRDAEGYVDRDALPTPIEQLATSASQIAESYDGEAVVIAQGGDGVLIRLTLLSVERFDVRISRKAWTSAKRDSASMVTTEEAIKALCESVHLTFPLRRYGWGARYGVDILSDDELEGLWSASTGSRVVLSLSCRPAHALLFELFQRAYGKLPESQRVNWSHRYDMLRAELRRHGVAHPTTTSYDVREYVTPDNLKAFAAVYGQRAAPCISLEGAMSPATMFAEAATTWFVHPDGLSTHLSGYVHDLEAIFGGDDA